MTPREQHWQAVVDAFQAVRRLPSLSAGVLAGGERVWTGSAGSGGGADVQYRIGSITKVMTAVLVLQCRDEGLVGLDDPLGNWVPESGLGDATVRQLLDHTSGAVSEPVGEWWERTRGRTTTALLADNNDRVWPAGQEFHYSNLGYGLLGELLARVRQESWADQVQQRIWAPLGMTRTSLLPSGAAQQGWSVHHLRGTLTPEPATDTGAMAPAGQVWSTITDLARFAAFLAVGDSVVLSRDSLTEMIASAGTPGDGSPRDGHGLGVMRRAGLVGHLGSMPGFQSSLFVDPDRDIGVVALTNSTTGFSGVDFTSRILGSTTPGPGPAWQPTTHVPEWAEELLGYWHWGNSAYEVRWHNERLEFFDLARGMLAEQFVWAGDRIVGHAGYHRGEVLHVVRDEGRHINHLECATFIYTRTPYDPTAPIPGGAPKT